MDTIPPKGSVDRVDVGGGAVMAMANPYHDWSILYHLTYGDAVKCRLAAASLIESYDYLLSGEITMQEATRRLRILRARRRDLRDAAITRS